MTPVKARVFVSHCGYAGVVRDVVQELISLLPKDNFDLLFDRLSLTPGDELSEGDRRLDLEL